MPLYLRVPEWGVDTTINDKRVKNGTMEKFICENGMSTFIINFHPSIKIEKW